MSESYTPAFSTGLRYGFGSLLYSWTAGIGACAYSIVNNPHENPFNSAAIAMLSIATLACLLGCLIQFLENQRNEEKEKKRRAVQAEAEAAEEARLRAMKMDAIQACAVRSVALYRELPGFVDSAKSHLDAASLRFGDQAFSPFWSEIEYSYVQLGYYQNNVRLIADEARRHDLLIREYEDAFGGPPDAPDFPLVGTDVTLATAATGIAERLSRAAYAAQKDPVFAQIWEQRRTTAAVVSGFQNLEQAVSRMTSAIVQNMDDLKSAIADSGRLVVNSVNASSRAQLSQGSGLVQEVQQVHKELVRQSEALAEIKSVKS